MKEVQVMVEGAQRRERILPMRAEEKALEGAVFALSSKNEGWWGQPLARKCDPPIREFNLSWRNTHPLSRQWMRRLTGWRQFTN